MKVLMFSWFWQVQGQLENITVQLENQRVLASEIMDIITELVYKQGIEQIEAAYHVFMQGKPTRCSCKVSLPDVHAR